MKKSHNRIFRALLVAAVAFAAAVVPAQQRGAAAAAAAVPGANPGEVKIKKITDLNSYKQKAKNIDGKTSQKSKTWGVFDASFVTAPEWIDSMTITYTVILLKQKVKEGEKPMTLFQTTVEYGDVAKGEHEAGVVLLPAALLRLGSPLGFAAQISVGGEIVAQQGVGSGPLSKMPEWWTKPEILDHPNVQRREGYLLDRMKSPFALVDIDSYEMSR